MIAQSKKINPAYLVVILLVINTIVVLRIIWIEKNGNIGIVDTSVIEKKNEILKLKNDSISNRIKQLEEEKIAFVRQIDSLQLLKGKIRKIYNEKYVQIDNYNSKLLLNEFKKYIPEN